MIKASIRRRTEPVRGHVYAIGIGSNRPLRARLGPPAIVKAAFEALDVAPLRLVARSPVIASRPIGPSARTYANAAALVAAPLEPLAMLDMLQAIERRFHRRRQRRWGARTLDLDLLLWSGGAVRHKRLTIPHAALAQRDFVLRPLRAIAPHWRDPRSGRSIAQLAARLSRPKPVDRKGRAL
ncbi:2-amino-4-hydroxy-6-hydroxymethyldihydropteridine pyrophosphokinase [Sphingobium sp. SYK-6]|uniref:2-amino-4-hydroxy-6- hydroxymethyldihydropteridine diphosphokinase n=1 Tax=Sphingobium sp. (strain NBRC 103272 / SYK-6) TaxID=627192 RepID=UPI000227704C|nr:2-amino-4-hydroxy-6-hydroxymethyldihydropteridine pyrophosphokinase [Sphingobium sp. SYK-6]